MLSGAYGYSYSPGHLRTCDFADGLAHWTADQEDMLVGRIDRTQHKLSAVLGEGARVIPDRSCVFVDGRTSGSRVDDGKVRINLHHVRFRATSPSFTVTFTDADAEPGAQTALSYVMLKPYFDG